MQDNAQLTETIFRLGTITRHRRVENNGILANIAEIANDYIGADITSLCVYPGRISESACSCAVRGPWEVDHSNSFLDQTKWSAEDHVTALQLETRPADTLYRRSELIDQAIFRDTRQYKDFDKPLNLGEHASAYHTRNTPNGGPTIVFSITQADASSAISNEIFARAQQILPSIFQAFDEAWIPVPEWVGTLKPQAKRILQYVLDGHDDEQIVARTGQSYHSVRAHLKRLFRVAQVRSRLHLMQAYLDGETSDSLDQQIAEIVLRRKNNGPANNGAANNGAANQRCVAGTAC